MNNYNEAFETYDLIVDWVIDNHPEIIEVIDDTTMGVDSACRLLRGMANENYRLQLKLNKAIELLARNDILQMNDEADWREWFDKYAQQRD